MSKRARIQIRMQETVEGLSIAAITYYMVGLISYIAKSIEKAGVPISSELVVGLSVLPTALLVWYIVRRIKKKVLGTNKPIDHI